MFALVQYLDDNIQCVVDVKVIKRFSIDKIRKKKFWVPYPKDGLQYKAQVLRISENKEELQALLKPGTLPPKRVRQPPRDTLETASDSSDLESETEEHLQEEETVTEQMDNEFQNIVERAKEQLLKNSSGLSTASGTVSSNSPIPTTQVCGETSEKLTDRVLEEEQEEVSTREEVPEGRRCNCMCATEVAALLDKHYAALRELIQTNLAGQTVANKEVEEIPDIPDIPDQKEYPPRFAVLDNLIHLGNDIWIKKAAYAQAKSMGTLEGPSIFVRDLAVAIWGYETLANSSITGRKAPQNRQEDSVGKPKLCPIRLLACRETFLAWLQENSKRFSEADIAAEMKKHNGYITSRIQDLQGRPSKKRSRQTTSLSPQLITSVPVTSEEAQPGTSKD